jgi:hypothetical protein
MSTNGSTGSGSAFFTGGVAEDSGIQRTEVLHHEKNLSVAAKIPRVTVWVRIRFWGDHSVSEAQFRRSVRNRRRRRFGLVILGASSVVIAAIFFWPRDSALRKGPLPPDPNGYDDLIRAGHSVTGEAPGPGGDYRTAGADELRKLVESNRGALALARVGLGRQCRVTLPASPKQLQAHMDRISDLRQLCRLMGAEARLAEIEGQVPETVRNGIDVIRVAQQGTRGGLLIDAMAGFACESIGQRILARSYDKVSAEECHKVVRELEAIDEEREPVDVIARRDRAWFSASQGFFKRAVLALSPGVNQMTKTSVNALEMSCFRNVARLRLLIAELAIRRYRLGNGIDPPSLDALVPRYMAKVPVDPYSGRPIHYRLEQGRGHRLYCVGPDAQDDGGKAIPERSDWSKARGDVLVDRGEVSPTAVNILFPNAGRL